MSIFIRLVKQIKQVNLVVRAELVETGVFSRDLVYIYAYKNDTIKLSFEKEI